MDNKMKKNKIVIIIMFFIGMFGIILLSYDYISSKVRLTFETVNLELYGNNEPKTIEQGSQEEKQILEENNQEKQETQNNDNQNNNGSQKNYSRNYSNPNYFAYLQIEKINLTQGLVPLNSKNNNVNKNIQTIYPSDYPDVVNGNLILAAHSGTSSIAYFKKLYLLNTNDQVNVIYNNEKYVYNITNIYTVPKNGEVAIYRDMNKTTLTLITCTKNDESTQTVYIAELIRKEGV